ncbi:MAG: TonB-dependent receptor plug domain-containing protein, partial [Gammaproteobacteria bacterium]|nr:TonB-dependent receptor plug domain-containing protein [Gammaproteobacteria bacterium]
MINRQSLFLFCLLSTYSIFGFTIEDDLSSFYGDEDFISIASGISQPISKAPAVASVVTAAQIKQIGALDIDDILETIPGLHVARNPIGYNPSYTFRGIHTALNPQVLMLINGIPLTNLFHGDRSLVWGGMPVESISRVEVIRGPGSAIYGADAFSGVINIITKTPQELDGVSVGLRAGSSNTKSTWVQYGRTETDYNFSAIVEIGKSDGQDEHIDIDAQTFLDTVSTTNNSLAPGGVELERESIDLRLEGSYHNFKLRIGSQIRNDGGLGAGIAQALDSNGRASSKRYNADLTYHDPYFTEKTEIKGTLSYLNATQEVDDDFILLPPGSTGSPFNPFPYPDGIIGNPEVYERHYRGNISSTFRGINRHELMAGAGYYFGEIYKVKEEKNFGIDPATGLPIFPGSPLVDVS